MISASLSLSLPRLGWKSTSMPRSLKICTAAGDNASEIRTLGLDMGLIRWWTMHLISSSPGQKREARLRVRNPGVHLFLMDGRVRPGHDDDGMNEPKLLWRASFWS